MAARVTSQRSPQSNTARQPALERLALSPTLLSDPAVLWFEANPWHHPAQPRTGYLIPSQAEYRFLKKGLLCWFNLCMSAGLVFVWWPCVILIFTWAGRGEREAGWQPDMERNSSPATERLCAQEGAASGLSWAGLGDERPPLSQRSFPDPAPPVTSWGGPRASLSNFLSVRFLLI